MLAARVTQGLGAGSIRDFVLPPVHCDYREETMYATG